MKAIAKIVDYGIELVEQLDNMPKVVVNFRFETKDDEIKYQTMTWDGFFLKRDGQLNEKTANALYEMGFRGEDPIVLSENTGLDIDHQYHLEIDYDDKGYLRIFWINRNEHTGGVKEIKKASSEALQSKFAKMNFKGAMRKHIQEKIDTNKVEIPNMFNSNEKMPF